MRRANPDDYASIATVYNEAMARCERKGLGNWPQTFDERVVAKMQGQGDLHCFEAGGVIVGAVCVSAAADFRKWGRQSTRALYVSRLARSDTAGDRFVDRVALPELRQFAEASDYEELRFSVPRDSVRLTDMYRALGVVSWGTVEIFDQRYSLPPMQYDLLSFNLSAGR